MSASDSTIFDRDRPALLGAARGLADAAGALADSSPQVTMTHAEAALRQCPSARTSPDQHRAATPATLVQAQYRLDNLALRSPPRAAAGS
jgi:hypothetical protein